MSGIVPAILSAAGGMLAVDFVPMIVSKFVPSLGSGTMAYLTQGATLFAGFKLLRGSARVGFVAGGAAKILYSLVAGPIMSLLTPTTVTTAAATAGYDGLAAPAPATMGDANPYGEGIF